MKKRFSASVLLCNSSAFSLIELMISLIVISCITAAFAPVVTKKLKSSSVSVSMSQGSTSEITTECAESFSDSCKLCTSTYCIQCELSSCASGTYTDSKTCSCKNCSDIFSNCIECDGEKCTKCKDNNFYINNGKCESCPANKICDGINAYDKAYCDNPPAGYFCDGTTIRKCTDKYSSYCATCDSSACKSCSSYYYLSGGNCLPCGTKCYKCTSSTNCTKCDNGYILDSSNICSKSCWSAISNCQYCSDAATCTTCFGKYYLNSANSCSLCSDTISNCVLCSGASTCTKCVEGYYVNSSNTCSQCTVSNCAQCATDGTCLSCKQGYYLAEDKKSCSDNENKFKCSDSNFMQIGNLCVTRKNMGDSSVLPIPSSVVVAQAGSDYCYANSSKCCWKGTTTTTTCNSNYGGYDGCTRTVCNWEAASEICSKFTYGGKTWRLPTKEEMASWDKYSIGLSQNGLMLCDLNTGVLSAFCTEALTCYGAYINKCMPRYVWCGAQDVTSHSCSYYLSGGHWFNSAPVINYAFSVRCVTEIE